MAERKLILYIACSVDGYIAKPDNDLTFLDIVQKAEEDYGYHDFIQTVDTIIMGRKTYDWVMRHVDSFPHADKESYIITRTYRSPIGNTIFYNGSLKSLVVGLKEKSGKNIFCDGGAEIVNELLCEKLFDEFIISVIPVIVGNGTRLFKEYIPEEKLKLITVKHFETGLVQLHYSL